RAVLRLPLDDVPLDGTRLPDPDRDDLPLADRDRAPEDVLEVPRLLPRRRALRRGAPDAGAGLVQPGADGDPDALPLRARRDDRAVLGEAAPTAGRHGMNPVERRRRVGIVATGDELSNGSRVDTNSAVIAQRMFEIGYETDRILVLGDDEDALAATLVDLASRCDAVIVT